MKRPDLEELKRVLEQPGNLPGVTLEVIDYALELEKTVHALVTKRTDLEEELMGANAALRREFEEYKKRDLVRQMKTLDELVDAQREAADYRAAIEDWAANCGLCRCRDVKELLARYPKPEEQG